MGDESLDVDEVGIGLDGAENMGQDGERGEVGLGFGGLQDRTIRKLVSTEGNHNGGTRFMGGQMMGSWSRQGALKPGCVVSAKSHFSRPDLAIFQVASLPQFFGILRSLSALQNSCFLGHRSFSDGVPCPLVEDALGPCVRALAHTPAPAHREQG